MADSYAFARQLLKDGAEAAAAENITLSGFGQAVLWELINLYKADGRSAADIISEIQYTLDNIEDDGTFHVSRN